MDEYNPEIYTQITKIAASFHIANQCLERIAELAPDLSAQEIGEAVGYALSLFQERSPAKRKEGGVQICSIELL